MKNTCLFTVLSISFLLVGGCDTSHQKKQVETIVAQVSVHFVPDSRVDLFDIDVVSGDESAFILKGETTLPNAKAALHDSLSQRDIAYTDSIKVLPDASLDSLNYGLVNNSVANIRSTPRHSAQLVTQATLGMPLQVLKKDGGWYFVQTPDDYLGWVDSGGLERMTETAYAKWETGDKLIYINTYGFSYREPSISADKVTDLVAGSILRTEGREGDYYRVTYPDGRSGYITVDEAEIWDKWEQNNPASQASLVNTAKTMMGAPYLWGGTSTKGIDCSGFTKTIYFMNGRIIPRDASQQVKAGVLIDDEKKFDKLETGDLLFFGRSATDSTDQRVVHVGMWIGDNQFIHSAGRVHVSSVDSTAENYDPSNLGRYLEARRYLDNWQGNIKLVANMYRNFD